jgi:hypothetical protein
MNAAGMGAGSASHAGATANLQLIFHLGDSMKAAQARTKVQCDILSF